MSVKTVSIYLNRVCETMETKSFDSLSTSCDMAVVKLSESFYTVKNPEKPDKRVQGIEFRGSKDLALSGYSVFIDPDISEEVRSRVSTQHRMRLFGCNHAYGSVVYTLHAQEL